MHHSIYPKVHSNTPLVQAGSSTLRSHLLDLFCQVAYREGDFTLSSGKKSSYYINSKPVTLHPQGALMVGRLILDMLPLGTDAVAGLTLGADPIVSAVSVVSAYQNQDIAALIVRKQPKGHGTQAYIEGLELPAGSFVVVLEDVVTTGQSALKAVDRLRQAGYQVNRIISLVDRGEGGADLYRETNLDFDSVFSIKDLKKRWATLNLGQP